MYFLPRALHAVVPLVPKLRLNTRILKQVKRGQGVAKLQSGFKTKTAASLKSKESKKTRSSGFFYASTDMPLLSFK